MKKIKGFGFDKDPMNETYEEKILKDKINEIIDCLNQSEKVIVDRQVVAVQKEDGVIEMNHKFTVKDQPEEEGWYCECGEKVEKGEHICEEELEGFIQQEIDRAREEQFTYEEKERKEI